MAQTYTLEEAAGRLGLAPEEFKRRLRDDWKQVRSFRDGATLRFRAADIDELARATGQASDPGLPLGSAPPLGDDSDELLVQPPSSKKKKPADQPLLLGDDSDDILALTDDKKKGKKGDSDVRLDISPKKTGAGDNVATEELSLDVGGPTSGVGLGKKSSAKLTNPKSSGRLSGTGKSKIPTPDSSSADDGSSEFELSLDSDSDSFELQLTNDSSEEVPLGAESPSSPAGQSGINLGRPADSGVSIEKNKKKKPVDESDVDFELSVDGPDAARSLASGPTADEGSSEFELSLDDSSGSESMNALASSVQGSGDIFETDFELPAVEDESGSEVVAVESDTDLENSDFEVAVTDDDVAADDGSASEVVLMEEDEGEPVAAGGRSGRSALAGLDGDDDGVVRPRGRTETVVRTVAPPPPKWGPLPAVVLGLTLPIVFLGAIMSFELVRSMAGYQQASPLATWVAGLFGMKTGA